MKVTTTENKSKEKFEEIKNVPTLYLRGGGG